MPVIQPATGSEPASHRDGDSARPGDSEVPNFKFKNLKPEVVLPLALAV